MPNRGELADRARQDVRNLLRGIAESLRDAILIALPALLRLVCLGVAASGAVYSAPRVWRAFGGDLIALLPAAAVVLLPLAAGQLAGLEWGGLLASGALSWVISLVVETASPITRALIVVVILAAVVFSQIKKQDERKETIDEQVEW